MPSARSAAASASSRSQVGPTGACGVRCTPSTYDSAPAARAAAVTAGLLMEAAERRAQRLRPQPAIRPPDPARGEKHPVMPLPGHADTKEPR